MASIARQLRQQVRSSSGRVLGRVERVLVDITGRTVAALFVRTPGPFSRKRLVPLGDVQAWSSDGPRLGRDKLPKGREVAQALGSVEARLDDPMGWPVETTSGRRLGSICDIRFDGTDGSITDLEVSRGMVGDLSSGAVSVPLESIRRLSAESTLVSLDEQTAETTMERVAGVVGRSAGVVAAKAKHTARRVLKDYKEKR